MRKHLAHGLAGVRIGGQSGDFNARVRGRQTHKIGAGVPRGADNGSPDPVLGHSSSLRRQNPR